MFDFLIPILQQHAGALVGVVVTAFGAAIARLIERATMLRKFEAEKNELLNRRK